MEEMTCPRCGAPMQDRTVGDVTVHRCSSCSGIFLDRADLGALSEAENDWHRDTAQSTRPLPRITADMAAPPPTPAGVKSYLEVLFGR